MFVNEQVDKSLEIKVKNIEYEQDAQRPFENQLYEFQVEWLYAFSMFTNWLEPNLTYLIFMTSMLFISLKQEWDKVKLK